MGAQGCGLHPDQGHSWERLGVIDRKDGVTLPKNPAIFKLFTHPAYRIENASSNTKTFSVVQKQIRTCGRPLKNDNFETAIH